ncbi:MAG: diguanylate cyclase [Sideroxydans sp.]|nr:diguanylate cyclase [Sideroxydans sp.]
MNNQNYIRAFWRSSIRRQLVVGFALASLVLMTVFGVAVLEQQRKAQYASSTGRAVSLAHALSISSTSWALANDLVGLQELVQGFARTSDLRRAFFVSPQGEVLASTNAEEVGFFVTDTLSRDMLATDARDQLVLIDQRNLVVVAHPVLLGGRNLGWIRVEMTRDAVNANLAALTWNWMGFGLISVVLVSLVAILLARRMTKGLQHLMTVASAVEHGWSKRRADVGRHDEIGKLSRYLDRMLDAIEQQKDLLSQSEAKYRFLADNISDVIWVMNLTTDRWAYVSPSVQKLLGYSAEEVMQQSYLQTLTADSRDKVSRLLAERTRSYLQGESGDAAYTDEVEQLRKDGAIVWTEITTHIARNEKNELVVLGVSRDIGERKKAEEQIRNLAFYDLLTQLPNRRLLLDRFGLTIAASKRSKRYSALMFIDLDNFKPLNDEHGHDVGDLLLVEVAHRITACVREMDTVSRFGGDEFVVMLHELSTDREVSTRRASEIAEKIRRSLGKPYKLQIESKGDASPQFVEHHCTASIGVVLFDQHCSSSEELLRIADDAMYQAKEGGRNQVRFLESRPLKRPGP